MNRRRVLTASLLLLPAPVGPALVAQQGGPLQQSFQRLDADGDGMLSVAEVNRFPRMPEKLAGADIDGDGRVSFAEFRSKLAGTTPAASDELTPGNHTRTIPVGDLERRYLIHVPPGFDAEKPTPVVIVFHGGGGNPESMVRLTGMDEKSDEAGFIAVYPYGTGPFDDRMLSFNGGECCASAMQNGIDDVGFTRALLDDLATLANVDADRVFATGLSNGGIMAHHVAAELADRIAAIAPVGGPLMRESIAPSRPVPVIHFHGTADEFAPFEGGFGKGAQGRKGVTDFRSVEHTIRTWVEANGCIDAPSEESLPDAIDDGMKVTRKIWSGGKNGSEVVLVVIENGGHTWPGKEPPVAMLGPSTLDISANDLMWEFFQKHPRKPTQDSRR